MAQSPVLQPVGSSSSSLLGFAGRRVLIGTGVAFIACTTVAAAALLFISASSGSNAALEAPAAPAVPSGPVAVASHRQPVVADRWYEDTTTVAVAKPVVTGPSIRDTWYLDHSARLAAPAGIAMSTPRVADRWYEEATTRTSMSTPRVADRWYEEATTPTTGKPAVSMPPVRDAWYSDGDATAPASALSEQARDNWYLDSTDAGR